MNVKKFAHIIGIKKLLTREERRDLRQAGQTDILDTELTISLVERSPGSTVCLDTFTIVVDSGIKESRLRNLIKTRCQEVTDAIDANKDFEVYDLFDKKIEL